jgi:hypothetical protein
VWNVCAIGRLWLVCGNRKLRPWNRTRTIIGDLPDMDDLRVVLFWYVLALCSLFSIDVFPSGVKCTDEMLAVPAAAIAVPVSIVLAIVLIVLLIVMKRTGVLATIRERWCGRPVSTAVPQYPSAPEYAGQGRSREASMQTRSTAPDAASSSSSSRSAAAGLVRVPTMPIPMPLLYGYSSIPGLVMPEERAFVFAYPQPDGSFVIVRRKMDGDGEPSARRERPVPVAEPPAEGSPQAVARAMSAAAALAATVDPDGFTESRLPSPLLGFDDGEARTVSTPRLHQSLASGRSWSSAQVASARHASTLSLRLPSRESERLALSPPLPRVVIACNEYDSDTGSAPPSPVVPARSLSTSRRGSSALAAAAAMLSLDDTVALKHALAAVQAQGAAAAGVVG